LKIFSCQGAVKLINKCMKKIIFIEIVVIRDRRVSQSDRQTDRQNKQTTLIETKGRRSKLT